jgi:cyclopropane fatty-acyl-phospholipid synthase-like methyltransferase
MKEKWNIRYAEDGYAYGEFPNEFFKQVIDKQQIKGKILFPGEGEGRNAVYAAKNGWDAFAFDISDNAKIKAEKLAQENGVRINYQVGDFLQLPLIVEKYDAAALIYAHFPPTVLSSYYKKTAELIKSGGILILEGFSKGHIPYLKANSSIGGPDNPEMLFSIAEIECYFPDFEIIQLEEKEVQLNEGKYHQGTGKVIRFVGTKIF